MTRLKHWLVACAVLLVGKAPRRSSKEARFVRPGEASPFAELVVLALFALTTLAAMGFMVEYALDANTQLLGLALGIALLALGAALTLIAKTLVVTEELVEEYPVPAHEAEQEAVEQIVDESGSRFTRKRLVTLAGAGAAGTLGLAFLAPAVSFGPIFRTGPFYETPWRRGRRLVDENGRPYHAEEIEEADFYTAFPEGADREQIGAPLVVVRIDTSALHLPDGRGGWAPRGILAYSKICTHAGCAINLYRTPTYPPTEPKPALVCPCHYSTFDVATGGTVIFGPAGRPLPQLPLAIDANGFLRADGNFSSPPGPAWWGTRMGKAHD